MGNKRLGGLGVKMRERTWFDRQDSNVNYNHNGYRWLYAYSSKLFFRILSSCLSNLVLTCQCTVVTVTASVLYTL